MQDTAKARAIPLLKIDNDFDQRWLEFTVQSIFQNEQLTTLYDNLVKTGEVVSQVKDAAINSDGALSQCAENGKYYCGQPVLSCECCDIKCGPNQGCNCSSCQALQNYENENGRERKDCPPLLHAPKSWFWRENLDKEHLEQFLYSLEVNQRNIIHETMNSVKSFGRLNKRITVLGRHLAALSRQCFGESKKEECKKAKRPAGEEDKNKEKVSTEKSPYVDVARNGIKTMLTFAFQILERSWGRGEDIDLCSNLLMESLQTLQKLPEAFLFNEADSSPLWNEVLFMASSFLEKVVLGVECNSVPVNDRKKALVLLFEIAFQHGTLHQMIQVIIVTLKICIANEDSELNAIPIGNILKRLHKMSKEISPVTAWGETDSLKTDVSGNGLKHLTPISNSPDGEAEYDLRVVSMEILKYLSSLTMLYTAPPQDTQEKDTVEEDNFKHEIIFWGGKNSPTLPKKPTVCGTVVEIPIKQICISETAMIILTRHQRVYTFQVNAESLKFCRLPDLSARIQVSRIASSMEGRHFLALSGQGEVYAWGSNDHGCLGNDSVSESAITQSPIPGLVGKHVIHIACGSDYSAAVTDEGELYTWGCGENGRLGHGTTEDCSTPKLVEGIKGHHVVDVACGSGNAHTLAVTADGRLWSWGCGKFGKLGKSTEEDCLVPEVIDPVKCVKHVCCGLDFSVCLTEDGKVWTWGCGENYQLGHGTTENVSSPKAIEIFIDNPVVDVAVGFQHCVAVAQSREVYFWGSHDPICDDGTVEKIPTVVGKRSGALHVGVAAGPSQTFCWSAGKARSMAAKVPFCIDISKETFEMLNSLLDLCDPTAAKDRRNQWLADNCDRICIYALKLLKLQLLSSKACGLKPLETERNNPKDAAAESLKAKIINLASRSDIEFKIRSEAQVVLRKGWSVLLPTAEERIIALRTVLADEDGARVTFRKRFLIDVLINSLMNMGGLDVALDNAVKDHASKTGRTSDDSKRSQTSIDILADFIELLLKIVTIDALERLSENEIEMTSQRRNVTLIENNICMILRYQRLLFARLFKGTPKEQYWPPTGYYTDLNPELRALSMLLKRYIQALAPCCKSLLKQGYEKVLKNTISYNKMSSFLLLTVPGIILREFLVLLTMAQSFAPAVASTSEGVPLLGELLDNLDMFNHSDSQWEEDDAADLAWSRDGENKEVEEIKTEKSTRKISKNDLDENAKQGNNWVSIHGRVYDLAMLKTQAPCGEMLLEHYAGRDATSVFDSMHHSEDARSMMGSFLVGELEQNLDAAGPTTEGKDVAKKRSFSSTFLDSERTLALILGLHAGHLARGVLVTSEELDKRKWIESELFCGGVESSAVLKECSTLKENENEIDDDKFVLETLLYEKTTGKRMLLFLENVKLIASQRDTMFSAIEFPADHPIEKSVRAILAATIKHLDLEQEAISMSASSIDIPDHHNERTRSFDSISKSLVDVIHSVYRQKLKLIRAHQEHNKAYETLCLPVIEKCRFVFYCLHPASGRKKREMRINEMQLSVSRWQEAVQRVSVDLGTFWMMEKWCKKNVEEVIPEECEEDHDFDAKVVEQLLDFVCEENLHLDMLRKCFLYQIKRVKQRLISGYMMQSYILRNGMVPSVRYSLLYGWMGMEFQCGITNKPKPGIANNIELVSVEELVKLKSVFDIIAHWAVDLLRKRVRKLSESIEACKDSKEIKEVVLERARFLTALLGMLTSQSHLDNIEVLVHSGIFASIQCILRCLEKAWGGEYQFDRPCPMAVIVEEARHHVTSIRNLTGAEMANLMKLGTRVVRGPDWKWGDQDGPAPRQGRVISDNVGEDGWVRVQWDTGSTNSYRMGKEGKYDLKLAEPLVATETSEEDNDRCEETKRNPEIKEDHRALILLHRACITVLQHTALLVCLKSNSIKEETIRVLSGLLMKIIREAYLENNTALRQQQQDWVTIGLLRGLCSSKRFRHSLSQPNHIKTLIDIIRHSVSIENTSQVIPTASVYIQVLILKLLGHLLPCITDVKNEPFIDTIVHKLINLLGEILIKDVEFSEHENGGRLSSRRKRHQASVTASGRGTIAEELVCVIRKMHMKPHWDKSISYVIEEALEKLPRYFTKAATSFMERADNSGVLSASVNQDEAAIVAILAIIGGADNRVRMGGTVENEEHGIGVVTRITKSGKISVQCSDEQIIRNSPLSLWRVAEPIRFDVDKLQNLSAMRELLPSVLHLAVITRAGSKQQLGNTADNTELLNVNDRNLKLQQIELGLLVAARSLLPHSNLISSLVFRSEVKDEGICNSWLLEELFIAALKPAPIRSIYDRSEVETAALTLTEYLLSSTRCTFRDEKGVTKKKEKHLKPPRRSRVRRNSSTRLPSPPLVVQQIVEMGFPRYMVEKALKEMGDDTIRPEMIVTWLLDHPEIAQEPSDVETHSDAEAEVSDENETDAETILYNSDSSSESDCGVTASEIKPIFKTRQDFSSSEDYEQYVTDHVKVGSFVRFKQKDETESTSGKVTKVCLDSSSKASIEVESLKGQLLLLTAADVEIIKSQERKIKVGDMVRVKASITSPKYKWGAVNHSNSGLVKQISPDGVECQVDFCQQTGWTGLVAEMELLASAHPGISCDGCHANPIVGPRFKCTTCYNFDLCEDCYTEMGNHRHKFYRYDEPGKSPSKCSKPPKNKDEKEVREEVIKTNLRKCVKDIWVMPDIDWNGTPIEQRKLYRLRIASKQKTCVCLEMNAGLKINKLTLTLDLSCPDCVLSSAIVSAGTSMISMRRISSVVIDTFSSSVVLLKNIEEDYRFIEIEINLCSACLAACKGNRLSIECTKKPAVHGIPSTLKFIGEDYQEELDRKLQRPVFKSTENGSRKPPIHRESKVFVWGLNDKEQLGGLKGSKIKTPILSQALSSLKCQHIVGGSKTIFAVTFSGKAYACGESTNGRLGLGPVSGNVSVPRQIEGLSGVIVKTIAVHSGGRHAMALTTEGKVYSWGEGEDGQLGHNNRLSYDSPKLIEALDGQTVIEIAAGSAHSAAIVSEGDLYTWGIGEYGRLGHGDTDTQLKPKMVKVFSGKRVLQVSCGSRDAQTICLTEDGIVWSWGDGDFGKLGRGGSEGCLLPQRVERLNGLGVCKCLCGAQFSLALTSQGKVYTWGKGDYYRLGHGSDAHVRRPQLVESLKHKKVVDVAVGALHCLAVCDDGQVYAWGDNDHGQQGNGTVAVNFKSAKVLGLDGYKVTRVACGSSHSIAWAELNIAPQILFDPVELKCAKDPLGTGYVTNEFEQKKTRETVGQHIRRLRSSLSKDVLQLKTIEEKQTALCLILESLRVCYARDALITLLDDIIKTTSSASEESLTGEDKSAQSEISNARRASSVSIEKKECDIQKEAFVLSLSKVKLLMSLLKLGFSGRLNEQQREKLSLILIHAAKNDKEIALALLNDCTTEIEDVVTDYELRKKELQPVTQDSPHPYEGVKRLNGRIRIPGAEDLRIVFDKNCCTEYGHDILTIIDGNGRTLAVRSGMDPGDWKNSIRITGDEVRWTFTAQSKGNMWGWRFVVHPQTSQCSLDLSWFSDRTALAVPSLSVAKSLLSHDLEQIIGPGSHSNRLTFALAACAQVPLISADKRCWIFRKLKSILVSDVAPPVDVPALIGCGEYKDDVPSIFKHKSTGDAKTKEVISRSPLGDLIRGLPDALRKQYEYEAKTGQHLFYSSFLRALVTISRTLGLNYLMCCSDKYHWSWFTRSCMANRVIESIVKRTPLPKDFAMEVRSRIQELSPEEENLQTEYENHALFTDEEDKQALSWLQRRPRDWSLSWGGGGNIYGWGHNHRGQLGGLDGSRLKTPQICENLSSLQPVQICGGEQSLFLLTADGKIHATGYGNGGRLGVGGMATLTSPRFLETLQHVAVKKIAVHSGGKHCLALTSDGEVFSWGEGDDGKLGHGNRLSHERPRVIESLLGKQVIDIACGGSHSAAISSAGELYTWGKGRYGRLGHGDTDTDDQLKPKRVEALRGFKVIDVACGSGDAQTLCLTDDDCVWSWGDGDFGKLGRGGSEGCKIPMRIDDLIGVGISKIECGSQFSLALSKSGLVFTWGKGDYFRLGHGSDDHVRRPRIVEALEGKRVISVACGSLHCVVCTDKGEVYTWGDNDEGQLGDGTTNAVQRPKLVQSFMGKKIDKVACGSAHTIAWSTTQAIEPCRLPKEIPAELTKLHRFSIETIRNRLLLLHQFSELFWNASPLLDIENSRDNFLFTQNNIELLRSSLTSTSKDSAFRKVINNTMIRDHQHGPILELNRVSVKKYRGNNGLAGKNGSKSVFAQACSRMGLLRSESLLLPHRVWKVKFIGESVDDCGGGYSESIAEMCEELQNGSLPLLIATPDSRDDVEGVQRSFLLNPFARSQLHMDMFKFLGIIIGIAIRTGSPLALNLAEPVWKQLSGAPLTLEDIMEIDRGFLPRLNYIREIDVEDDAVDLPFTVISSCDTEIQLGDKHSKISAANKSEYLKVVLQYRLHEFDQQIAAVREGMAKVVPVPLLIFYSGIELETMVCGSPHIPVDSLKAITSYKNVDVNENLVTWFWEVIEEFTSLERSLFLRFVWGRARLPRTAADFRGRDFVFQVLDKFSPPNAYLPESYTCFFMLKMPRYTSKLVLREKLKYAIHFCKSIDSDEYARVDLTGES